MAQNISIMPIRLLNKNGGANLANAVKSIDYAVENGADVISASWGGSFPDSIANPIAEAIERAEKAGVLFVAAAANSSKNNDTNNFFPTNAPYSNVIAVAATGEDDKKASFSNYGEEKVHLGAPGVDILSTIPGDKYKTLSGTSMATPLVAGMVALQISLTEDEDRLDPKAIKALMQSTGSVNDMEVACNCRVDAGAAMESLANDELLLVPNTFTAGLDDKIEIAAIGGEGPYRFEVANQQIGSIDTQENGGVVFVGSQKGETKVVAYDSNGKRASTGLIRIETGGSDDGDECTMGSFICGIQCMFNPDLPFCDD
jgi:thermitase